LENMRGRFNLALGVGASGFSEGVVCAIPQRDDDVDRGHGTSTPNRGGDHR
jgi:hypothetical protein